MRSLFGCPCNSGTHFRGEKLGAGQDFSEVLELAQLVSNHSVTLYSVKYKRNHNHSPFRKNWQQLLGRCQRDQPQWAGATKKECLLIIKRFMVDLVTV
ncbi:uncharacterized protein LOC143685051 isoform X2 [Tamandua tetradactyla]|uniref:uncharacterized protein LOC143685051 isoform X2 n=1 Tax=Tamandua tetradactyla TaxID=48850 RepID=UPI00405489EE